MKPVSEMRFLELVHAGHASADEIDDYIGAWHDAPPDAACSRVPLHVHLGMTWTEYQGWGKTGILPTEAEHHRVPNPDQIRLADGRMLNVHGPQSCRQPPCPVHAPSDHRLAHAPLIWRADRGIMERACLHGIGHPDPDDPVVRGDEAQSIHGCDGCCSRLRCVTTAR